MARLRLLLVATVLAAWVLGTAIRLPVRAAAATVPVGPRLATVTLTDTPGSAHAEDPDPPVMGLRTLGPGPTAESQLLLGGSLEAPAIVPMPFFRPSWSADGSLLAFVGSSGRERRIYTVAADGSGLRAVAGTSGAGDPVLSPDGHTLAFARTRLRTHVKPTCKRFNPRCLGTGRIYSSATLWIADLAGGAARRLTPWRNGLSVEPSSFSPDGLTLALTRRQRGADGPQIELMRVAAGTVTKLVRLGEEPSFSPDGSQIAFVGYRDRDVVHAEEGHDYTAGELYTASTDGTGLRRLTRSRGVLESSPSWDPSGERLAYISSKASHGFDPTLDLLFPTRNSIMQINADGSCASRLVSEGRAAFYGVAWQPGADRGAGPIAC